MIESVLKMFKAVVVDDNQAVGEVSTDLLDYGVVLDFVPTPEQFMVIKGVNKPLNMTTLFGREERMSEDFMHLITKQVLHYVEVYGFGMPGLFNLELAEGRITTFTKIRGITVEELTDMIHTLIYKNAPLKNAEEVKEIIESYGISFDKDKIQNNEVRIALFDEAQDRFEDGDDAVRYIIYKTTGTPLLIKSKEVIRGVANNSEKISAEFLENHMDVLAQVFNRHKRILLALKGTPKVAKLDENQNTSFGKVEMTIADLLDPETLKMLKGNQ